MAAEILTSGGALGVGTVQQLFGGIVTDSGYLYAPSADGQRFIVARATSAAVSPPLTLVHSTDHDAALPGRIGDHRCGRARRRHQARARTTARSH